ncbi:ABC transporter substrate-binding protein [Zhaonella formicivorans]|uniref:ABC transporter substrate-binding protein n=1 Tax=Zhaonella formicivorans TaxID=2528593 RepID=UPI001D103203|nr:ABC transporter substrate-binding protein [Zhaonella formicivorans]
MKNKRKVLLCGLLVILMLGLLALAGCGGKTDGKSENALQEGGSSGQGTIKLGWVAPLTGTGAAYGEQMLNGAKLAAEEINAAGGINGEKIEIVPQDDKSDPKEAASIANKFVNDSGILAVVGNYNSSCALSGAPIYTEAELPMIHVGTSPAFTEQNYPYLFRISVTDAFQGVFVSEWMYEDGYRKAAILYENDDYGRGLNDVVTKKFKELGGEIVASESYMLGETKDYTALLTKVKSAGADVLFIGGLYTEAALIAKQMKQVNLDIPVYGTDGIYENIFIELGGEAVEGFHVSGLLVPSDPDPKVQEFVQKFEKAYGFIPGTYAAYHYDATKLLAQAIQAVGKDRVKIKEYLEGLKEPFPGVTGAITFNETHDAMRTGMKRMVVEKGQWTLDK